MDRITTFKVGDRQSSLYSTETKPDVDAWRSPIISTNGNSDDVPLLEENSEKDQSMQEHEVRLSGE